MPACPNPTSIAVGSITSSTAIVSWTGNSSALYYEVALQAPASGIPTGTGTLVTQASYSLSGLSPNTSYEIYVRSACGGVFSNWEGPRVFTTTCVTATIPYLRDFNTWPPSCWNLTGGTQTVSQANNDYLVASLYSWTSGNFALAATEPISISAPARLKFNWSHLYSTTYPNDQMILQAQVVGTTTWDTLLNLIGPTFTTPGAANLAPAPAANFIRQSLILPQSYVGQEVTFRFRFNSGFGPHVYIDNFIVESLPPCPDPTSGTAVNIGVNDATGTWSPVAGAISYEVAILPSGTGLPTGPGITTTDTFYTFSGLQPQTSYSYFVRVTCAAGVGIWYGPVTFRTQCGPVNSFFEDFEAYPTGSIVPECWNRLIVGSASQTITTTTPASGIRNIYQFSSAGTASYVILPAMQNISAGTHRITVKLRMSSGVGHLEVGYLTDINDASTFTAFAVLNPANTVYGPVSIVNIPAGLPSNARIAIANRAVAASLAHYWDDLRYELLPACPEPTWLPVTATTTSGATLNWTAVAPAQSYELQVVASGSGLSGTPVAIAGGNTSYAVS
ncbi:MAG: fibronectin type III domain-containing protein, partial [Bacteroidetes bacterium]|nr:fibronectin type III domain-containing protein [Bacteroidota bacterium]